MRCILTLLVLSSKTFHLVQAKLTNIEGILVDLEKLNPPVVKPVGYIEFHKRFINYFETNVSNIINGQDSTNQKQFPYQAALFLKRNKNDKEHSSFCGGSLISSRTILTAAHCLDGMAEVEVCLGCMNFKNEQEQGRKRFVVQKSSMIIHENWNAKNIKNDIALLILDKDVPFSDTIKPLRFPTGTQTFEGVDSNVSGWGKTKTHSSGISKHLKYINTLVMKQKTCEEFYKLKLHYNIDTHQLCTDGSEGKSTCQGDSGGPLVVKSGNDHIQIGIVSFGALNCEMKAPSLYTRVSSFLTWIEQKKQTY